MRDGRLNGDQLGAAADLLRRRVRDLGGPVEVRARELCEGELRGWVSVEELLGVWEPEVCPGRWVGGEHDRELNYVEPGKLEDLAGGGESGTEELSVLEVEREVIARILRRLEAGGGLLRRRVRWGLKYYTMQAGERVTWRRGVGSAQCGGVGEEWLTCAVLILCGEKVVRVFPEARFHRTRPVGWCGKKKRVIEMRVPVLEVPELGLRRIAMNVAVLLKRLRMVEAELRSGAAIARAAGVTRANVSARYVRQEAEDAAEVPMRKAPQKL